MASTGEAWRLGRRPALDGLRGIAVLLVVASHATRDTYPAVGTAGVSIFFALSGFLITSLLMDEYDKDHRISFAAFYRRRAFRLLPALFAFLAVMLLLNYAWFPRFASPSQVLPVLLYLGNLPKVFEMPVGTLGHTWSLAVEEQFYIAYPLAMAFLLRHRGRRALVRVLVVGLALSIGLRIGLWLSGASAYRIYFATDTTVGLLIVGCLAAIYMRGRSPRQVSRHLATAALVAVALLAVSVRDLTVAQVLVPIAAAVLATLAIVAVTLGDYSGWLHTRWLVLVGQRSYGLYLWHYPLAWILVRWMPISAWVGVSLLLGLSWGVTLLSWRYVEEPWLRRGRSRSTHPEEVRRTLDDPAVVAAHEEADLVRGDVR